MIESTAALRTWKHPASRWRRRVARPLVLGLLLGALVGTALTAFATGPLRSALDSDPRPDASVRSWAKRPLEPQWRGYREPFDASAMFRKRAERS